MEILHVITPSMRGLLDANAARARENMMSCFITSQFEQKGGPQYQVYTGDILGTFITDARNDAVRTALLGKELYLWPTADWLVMIDDDMVPPPDTLIRLMERKEGDIVVPLFHQRGEPYDAVIMEEIKVKKEGKKGVGYKMVPARHGEFQRVDAAGFGIVKINVHTVLEHMTWPWFVMPEGYEVGEDIYFCHKARYQVGARIFCDTTIDVGHIAAPTIIDLATSQALKKARGLPPAAPMKVVKHWGIEE